MKIDGRLRAVGLAGAWLILCLTVSQATPAKRDGTLTPSLSERLRNLPYGLSNHKSLFLRYRHVESVQFFGAGNRSRYVFKSDHSLVPEGLSLFLYNGGKENWASGTIH